MTSLNSLNCMARKAYSSKILIACLMFTLNEAT